MMKRLSLLLFLLLTPIICDAAVINVTIKGVDDGVKTNKQQDYKEALINAKLQAIERAGVEIESVTRVVNFQMRYKAVESKAEAVLLPGFQVMDIGYQKDGTYLVALIAKVKTVAEGIDTKELRYAKSLMERGETSKARKIITDIMNKNKDDNAVAEAIYYQVLWKFASDDRDTFEKLKAYYPNSKYVSRLEPIVKKREEERKRVIGRDGRFIAYAVGTVKDTKTGLMWAAKDNGGDINWPDAKRYCENYRGGGYSDWRMPYQNELALLYDRNKENRHGFHVTELIDISDCCPWALEGRGPIVSPEAANFNFYCGSWHWHPLSYFYNGRALPVRGGN